MLAEIIRELTVSDENKMIPSECVLTWAKGVEDQRAKAAVINSLHGVKTFIQYYKRMKVNRDKQNWPHLLKWIRCKYCGQVHKPRW